jgi:hypothetical protein
MNKKLIVISGLLLAALFLNPAPEASAADAAPTNGTPVIQFENTFFDFGKISALGKVSGSFKFKNAGDGVLKVDPPKPSCGCTDAKVAPDVLAPGQSGEITYNIKLDHAMGQVQKHISIYSNDPKNPDVQLTMQLDCTPLYQANPKMLRITLPPGKDEVEGTITVIRTDGLASQITTVVSDNPAVAGELDSDSTADMTVKKAKIVVHRPATPTSRILGNIRFWADDNTNAPMESVLTWCEVQGELSAMPTQMYWVMPNLGNSITNYSADVLTRTMLLKSTLGQTVNIKNVSTNIKGLTARAVPKGDGKSFDLVLKFEELPRKYTAGVVTVDTGSDKLPKLEVQVTVATAQ